MAIEKLDNGKFKVRVRVPAANGGGYFPIKSFDNQKDAKTYESQLKFEAGTGKMSVVTSDRGKTTTLVSWFFEWRTSVRNVSSGWALSQAQIFRDYIFPTLGQKVMSKISGSDITLVFDTMKKKGLGTQSQLHVYNLLNKLFKDALCQENPIVMKNPMDSIPRPKVIAKPPKFLTPDESMKLLDRCRHHWLAPAIYLGLLTGMRSESIIPLKVKDVDLDNGKILLRSFYKRKVGRVEDYSKTNDFSYVPIPRKLYDFLKDHLVGLEPDDFVVRPPRSEMLSYHSFYGGLKSLCKAAGVAVISCHCLRHSTSEIWMEKSASEEDIRQLLGHKNSSTTRRYMHRTSDRLMELAGWV